MCGPSKVNISYTTTGPCPWARRVPDALEIFKVSSAEVLEIQESSEAYSTFLERGWGDGLPIVAPEKTLVDSVVDIWGREPNEHVMAVPPSNAELTIQSLVINAVMAGCDVSYLPYVEAALLAMSDERFNLSTVQTTTSPIAPLILVNGPGVKAIGMNCGPGSMGPGRRANATIGRAVRLILMNVGEAHPDTFDRSSSGLPTKYSWCVAENAEDSPWAPLHATRGFKAEEDVVTVFGGHGPITACDAGDVPARQLLYSLSQAPNSVGANLWFHPGGQLMVLLSPDHAHRLNTEGYGRNEVAEYIWSNARLAASELRQSGCYGPGKWPDRYERLDDGAIPIVVDPDDVLVAVVGGAGPYSHVVPSHGACGHSVSYAVDLV